MSDLQRDIARMERLVDAVGDEYDEAAVQRIRAALQALHAAVVPGDLQRDVALVQEAVAEDLREESWDAWQRIRARLNPDREKVARAMCRSVENGNDAYWRGFLPSADAAIAAMGETP